MAETTTTETATATRNTNSWTVRDPAGGVWWPDEDAAAEIESADDPAATAVRIATETPMRGTWVQ
jgi:hypothetical protein